MEIYSPEEDSMLLKGFVSKYSKGIVLDMGTGSGIQAVEAASVRKVVKVYAVDINPDAIAYCRSHIDIRKIVFLRSNLFSVFNNKKYDGLKFDTILFNAPYLPSDTKDRDVALDGGRKGHELIQRFFHDMQPFLKPRTRILLVFSSKTDKDRVERIIRNYRMVFRELDRKHVFFENIFVYLVERVHRD